MMMNKRETVLLTLVLIIFGTEGPVAGSLFLTGTSVLYLIAERLLIKVSIKDHGEHGEIPNQRRDKKAHFEIWEVNGVYRSSWICPECDQPMEVVGYVSSKKEYFGSFLAMIKDNPESFVEVVKIQKSLANWPTCGYCCQQADLSDRVLISGRPRAIMGPDHKLVIKKEI